MTKTKKTLLLTTIVLLVVALCFAAGCNNPGDEDSYLCPHCGYELTQDDTVCPGCGAVLVEDVVEELDEDVIDEEASVYDDFPIHCGKCGHGIVFEEHLIEILQDDQDSDYVICPECGDPVYLEDADTEEDITE